MATIARDRIGGPDVIDWSTVLTADGPIAVGVGAAIVAGAHAIRTRRQERKQARAFVGAGFDDVDDLRLRLAAEMQATAQSIGAVSAVLLRWSSTQTGGEVTAIAEWPGTDAPSSPRLRRYEMGPVYRRDVITPLRAERWLYVDRDTLQAEALSDLYLVRDVSCAYLRLVADDESTVLYVEVRYRHPPTLDASIREPMRELSARIAEMTP